MKILKNILFSFFLLLLVQSSYAQSPQQIDKSGKIRNMLNEIITQENMPGMIAAIISSKGIIAIGSAGIRKEGSSEKLTENDAVHIGSCGKAMISTMLATLVAEKILSWETRLIEAMPDLKDSIHPDYHNVTIWQLITHRSGFPGNANWGAHRDMKLNERRIKIIKDALQARPVYKQGEFHYSNLGYVTVACMAERITGLTWEQLMKDRLFNPLDMDSAGFGPPGTPGKIDQPWGHVKPGDNWQPTQSDLPEAIGPAGLIHCNLKDWAKFLALQLPDGKNKTLSLDRKLLNKLITPTGGYAAGWEVSEQPWGKGIVLTHTGCNGRWCAKVIVAPGLDRAFIAVTNSFDTGFRIICDGVIREMIEIDRWN